MHSNPKASLFWLGLTMGTAIGAGLPGVVHAQQAAPEPGAAAAPNAPAATQPPAEAPATEANPADTPTADGASPSEPPAASTTEPQTPTVPATPATPESAPPAVAPLPAEPAPTPAPAAESPAPPAPSWDGSPAMPEDTPTGAPSADSEKAKKSQWRASRLAFEQSVTTQTLGVGQDYQSKNPTYDWTLALLPRYYFIDRDEWSYSVRASVSLVQELTNNDATTEQRELDFADSLLQLRYDRLLYESGDYATRVGLGLPEFVLPTSKASRNNGRILGVGAGLVPYQEIPLASGPYFSSVVVSGLARYQHYFANAQVPTNDQIQQNRTDLDGRSVVSDQLSSAPFAKHEARFGFATDLAVHEKVTWSTDFQWRPIWNYEVDQGTQICLATGCTDVDGVQDPQTFEVVTSFATEVEANVFDQVSFTVGYLNLTNQIGPDGQRRTIFYSPDARFYLTVNFYFGEVIDPGSAPRNVVRTAQSSKNLFAF